MNLPANTPDINFIPQEVIDRRHQIKSHSSNNRISVILFVLVLIASGVAFYFNFSLKNKIEVLNQNIAANEKKISDLQDFGKHGYKLGIRLQNTKQIISNRSNFSYMMDEFAVRMPETVSIRSVEVTADGLVFNGVTLAGYPIIAQLQDSLMEEKSEGKNLFTDAKLRSSNFNKSSGEIEFTIDVVLSEEIKKSKEQ
jgi:Tfp pilus assembly protein PilN